MIIVFIDGPPDMNLCNGQCPCVADLWSFPVQAPSSVWTGWPLWRVYYPGPGRKPEPRTWPSWHFADPFWWTLEDKQEYRRGHQGKNAVGGCHSLSTRDQEEYAIENSQHRIFRRPFWIRQEEYPGEKRATIEPWKKEVLHKIKKKYSE